MTDSDESLKQLMDEEYARDIFEEMGGVEVFIREMQEFHDTVTRLWDEYDALMEKYPDKWVAMGKDGIIAVCDSRKEVFSAIAPVRARGDAFIVEFLDTDPEPLVL